MGRLPPVPVDAGYIVPLLPLLKWAHADATRDVGIDVVLAELIAGLAHCGVPVARANLTLPTLHPQFAAASAIWRDNGAHEFHQRRWTGMASQAFQESPVKSLLAGTETQVHQSLETQGQLPWPVLDDFRSQGFTDYLGLSIPGDHTPNLLTLTTRAPGGFQPEHLRVLELVVQALRPTLQLHVLRTIARNICQTYIGPVTGPLVLSGAIRRGSVESLDAVVWFCALRGFTALSEALGSQEMVTLLNAFFGAITASIEDHQGEILKFIGDAALAIFPVRRPQDLPAACTQALGAARQAIDGIEALNDRRREAGQRRLEFGIGLNVGEVSYGNIGGADRLDFTVIGPAVNLASRLEGLCASLDEPLVASEHFAAALPGSLRSLGLHSFKGVRDPVAVFGLV